MGSCMTSGIELFLPPPAAAVDNFHRSGWIPALQPQINVPGFAHLLLPHILNYQHHSPTGEPGSRGYKNV